MDEYSCQQSVSRSRECLRTSSPARRDTRATRCARDKFPGRTWEPRALTPATCGPRTMRNQRCTYSIRSYVRMYCSHRICWTNTSFEKEAAQERLLKYTARKCAAVGLQRRQVAVLLCTSDGMMTPASNREPTTSSAVPSRKRNTARATERHGNLRGGRSNCANEQIDTYERMHLHLDMIWYDTHYIILFMYIVLIHYCHVV